MKLGSNVATKLAGIMSANKVGFNNFIRGNNLSRRFATLPNQDVVLCAIVSTYEAAHGMLATFLYNVYFVVRFPENSVKI